MPSNLPCCLSAALGKLGAVAGKQGSPREHGTASSSRILVTSGSPPPRCSITHVRIARRRRVVLITQPRLCPDLVSWKGALPRARISVPEVQRSDQDGGLETHAARWRHALLIELGGGAAAASRAGRVVQTAGFVELRLFCSSLGCLLHVVGKFRPPNGHETQSCRGPCVREGLRGLLGCFAHRGAAPGPGQCGKETHALQRKPDPLLVPSRTRFGAQCPHYHTKTPPDDAEVSKSRRRGAV